MFKKNSKKIVSMSVNPSGKKINRALYMLSSDAEANKPVSVDLPSVKTAPAISAISQGIMSRSNLPQPAQFDRFADEP